MFASAVPSTNANTTATASSPPRTSRLRGLSYLRNYTSHQSRDRERVSGATSSPATSSCPFAAPTSSSAQASPTEPESANSPSAASSSWPSNALSLTFPTSASSPPHSGTDEEAQTSPSLTGISKLMARHKSSNSHGGKKGQAATSVGQEIRNFSRATRTTSSTTTAELPPVVSTPPRETPSGLAGLPIDQMPTIKFIPHQDPRATKPSLMFPATSRTLPHEDCVIRVGRFSEKDGNLNPAPGVPSSNPVGFKSKVVSRRHCEFWCSQGQWYIKDVRSSSGTFLNHIRLSQPSVESRPFPVNDGDVVQLGIDFRGGEEMIFRCVKIRIECNRSWQKGLNNFNTATHKRLRALAKPGGKQDSDAASTHSSECAICLMAIAPCQSLFVAPCSHVWHFKCIRPILTDVKTYPQFLCPNCRAVSDLEADVDDPAEAEDWEEELDNDAVEPTDEDAADGDGDSHPDVEMNGLVNGLEIVDTQHTAAAEHNDGEAPMPNLPKPSNEPNGDRVGAYAGVANNGCSEPEIYRSRSPSPSPHLLQSPTPRQPAPRGSSPSASFHPGSLNLKANEIHRTDTPSTEGDENADTTMSETQEVDIARIIGGEGPLTPRNDVGPFVFDGGSGGRGVVSLNGRREEGRESIS